MQLTLKHKRMRMVFAGLGLAGLAVFIPVRTLAAENDATIVRKPTSIGMGIEMGQIVKGEDWDSKAGQSKVDVDMAFLQRLSIGITESAIVKEKLYLKAGVGGMFWYSFPRKLNATEDNLLKFGPGITEASAKYMLGKTSGDNYFKLGLFPFKYNPDAPNLGEYLFRSGTYPGFVWNGGWGIVNSASYFAHGIHAHMNLTGGRFTQDVTLFMERDFAPYFDFTPSILLGFKSAPLDLGMGVSFNHLLAKTSRLAPKTEYNAYVVTPSGNHLLRDRTDTVSGDTGYFTHQGIKLMARASFDPKAFFSESGLKPADLRIFAEAAILGVKNQPVYYENILERIPVMFGINLPGFRVFDCFSVQGEYHNSPYEENINNLLLLQLPIWQILGEGNTGQASTHKANTKDDWKWSVLGTKKLVPGLGLSLQVASDHLRSITKNWQPGYMPLTNGPDQWYYMVRLDYGI